MDRKEAELKCAISRLNNEGGWLQSGVTNLMNKINEHNDEIEKLQTAKGRVGDNAHQQDIHNLNETEAWQGK